MKNIKPLCWVIAVVFVVLAFADHHANQRAAIKATQDAAADVARREQYKEDSEREAIHQQKLQAIRNNYNPYSRNFLKSF